MVWDLRRALLRKEEFESGRLTDFEFRETVRAIKLLARQGGVEAEPLLDRMAEQGVAAALAMLGLDMADDRYTRAKAEVRRTLIAERGDPTPHRLG